MLQQLLDACLRGVQAQLTELVLQRFQSAELGDLPALLRFLLQHVNPQNASQVTAAACTTSGYCEQNKSATFKTAIAHLWGAASVMCCNKR